MGSEKPNVVVIGGSYVGARSVDLVAPRVHKTHNVVLIEKNSHYQHIFAFPRMHAVPGFEHKAFLPFTSSFFKQADDGIPPGTSPLPSASTKVIHGTVTSILSDKVLLEGGDSVPYEYLILATGTGRPGPLISVTKKLGISIAKHHQANVNKANHIVIVGGGAYGVQLATDLKTYEPTRHKQVTLVHSRSHLLNRFHQGLHEIVMSKCKELGVEVVLENRVVLPEGGFPHETTDEPFEVQLSGGGSVRADLVILCSGPAPLSAPLATLSPSAIDPLTRYVHVKPTLQISPSAPDAPQYPNVFAVGDVADTGAHKAARPGYFQAEVIARNIERLIKAKAADATPEDKIVQLDEYKFDPPGIHLSLGLKEGLIFRNPRPGQTEPSADWDEPGKQSLDINCARQWRNRASGVEDMWL